MIACEKCDALNPKTAEACGECGASLAAGAPPPLPGEPRESGAAPRRPLSRRQRQKLDPEGVERSRQRQEFGRIKSIVFTVRSVYLAGTAFAVVQLLLYHFMLAPQFAEFELETVSLIVGAVSWTQFALLLAGSRFIKRAPFPWTLVGASYWTIGTGQAIWVSTLADGLMLEDSRVLAFLTMMVLMTFAFWFAVAQAKRVAALMAANPELQLERKRIAPEERSLGGIAEEAKMRNRGERQRSNMANLRIILLGSAILVLGGGGVWAMTRPASADDSVDRFRTVWAQGDLVALSKLLPGGEHGRGATVLRDDLTQRGWHEKMPELAAPEYVRGEQRVVARFPCAGEHVITQWQLDEKKWRLSGLTLPDLVPTSIDDGVAAFRRAWQSDGMDALLAMIRSEDQNKIGGGIKRILAKRDWLQKRPELGEVDPGRVNGSARSTVLFEIEDSELRVNLQYWHPSWRIVGFRPPPR